MLGGVGEWLGMSQHGDAAIALVAGGAGGALGLKYAQNNPDKLEHIRAMKASAQEKAMTAANSVHQKVSPPKDTSLMEDTPFGPMPTTAIEALCTNMGITVEQFRAMRDSEQ